MTTLLDMNLSPRWQEFLTNDGFHTLHWSKVGKANDPDAEIMSYAIANEMAILTADLDFGIRLAKQGDSRPSVIQIRGGDVELEAVGEAVLLALKQAWVEIIAGALVTVDPRRLRVRRLPVKIR